MLSTLQQSITEELEQIRRYCNITGRTVAVAESVSSGCLQLLLSTAPSAGEFYQGGITAYNCAQKSIHLGVEPINAEKCYGVSQEIAIRMAAEASRLFRAQVGIGITGFATKVPEEGIDRLYAYYAIVMNGAPVETGELTPFGEGIDAQWNYSVGLVIRLADLLATMLVAGGEIRRV